MISVEGLGLCITAGALLLIVCVVHKLVEEDAANRRGRNR